MKYEWPKSFIEWRDGDTLNISVPFTWELPAARERILQMTFDQPKRIRVGGPAIALMPNYFKDLDVEVGGDLPGVLQRFNPQATRTTRGCPKHCPYCAVPRTEGDFVELDDWPDGPIVCDNNLLNASDAHFDLVCDLLEPHRWADFNQGLDVDFLTEHHAERMKRIGDVLVRLAIDGPGEKPRWEHAFELLRRADINKHQIASYVLVGFNSDPSEAWDRCAWVEGHGVHACPMWFHALDALDRNIVTREQFEMGWTDYERRKIMQWFYRHKNAVLA
jgi:hypothetical protein